MERVCLSEVGLLHKVWELQGMGGDTRTRAGRTAAGTDRSSRGLTAAGAGAQLWGVWRPVGAGHGDPQTRLAGHIEASATEMRHLLLRLLGPGEVTLLLHTDGSLLFRTSSSKLCCMNVLSYCCSCLTKR